VLGPLAPGRRTLCQIFCVFGEKSRKIPGRPGATKALADALKKIDPAAAEKAGIK